MKFKYLHKKNLLKTFALLVFALLLQGKSWGQVTIFTESMGTVGGTTTIAAHETANGYDNDTYTMSGTGDMRNTTASTGYTGASGLANVFLTITSGKTFEISGIVTSGYSSLTLTFGLYASGGTTLKPTLEVSSDGTTYSPLTIPAGTTTWSLVSATGTIPSCANLRIRFTQNQTAQSFRIDDITLVGTLSSPTLTVSPTTLTGFTYVQGAGPSASQTYNLSGSLLTGFPADITVTGTTDYEVSTDNSAFSGSVTVAYTSATLASTPIYVRLKAGLTSASSPYNLEAVSNAGGGATTVDVTCSGTVTAATPTLNVSAATFTGFTYVQGSGPSASQTYNLSGIYLTGFPANITVTGSTNYEVSTDNATFSASVTVAYASATLAATPIYIRLKAGLTSASSPYNAELVSNAGGGAATVNVTCSGTVTAITPLITVTGTLSSFGNACLNVASAEQSYTVEGSNLTANLVVNTPAHYQLSLTSGAGFVTNPTNITLVPGAGTVATTTIYARFNPTSTGVIARNINHTSTGALTVAQAVTGTGVTTPTITTTTAASSVTTTTASSGGSTLADGGSAITAKGVCWNTAATPTLANSFSSDGTGTVNYTSSLTGLSAATLYYVRAYVTNACGTAYGTQVTFTTLKGEPTSFPTVFACGTPTATTLPLTWTDAAGAIAPDGYLIKWSSTSYAAVTAPADGTAEANGAGILNVAQGTQAGTPSALTPGTTYYFKIWSYTNSGTGINYKLTSEPQTSCTTTAVDACGAQDFAGGTTAPSGWTFTTIAGTYSNAAPATPSGTPQLQMDGTGDAVETAPVVSPSALSFYIKGNAIGATSALKVEGYDGTSWTQIDNITGISTAAYVQYSYSSGLSSYIKFRFTYTKVSGNLAFDDVNITCNACATPTTQALNINFTAVYSTTMNVLWTSGNGAKRVVIMNNSNSFTDPTNGTDPTANTVYGGAGEQVIYNGTGSTVAISGLSASTAYYFRVYEYNCTSTNTNYNVTTATNNPNTQTTNPTTSNSSDIIRHTGFTEPSNIAYGSYQEANLVGTSLEVARFTMQDGGGAADADAFTTTLTDISFSVMNSANLRRIALYDGTTELSEVAAGATVTFTGLTIAAADGGSKDFSIRASFLSTVTDNQQIKFTVTAVTANGAGSTFAAADAGGAASSIAVDYNRIEVSASQLTFGQQPTGALMSNAMSPAVTVNATDANSNVDLDYSGNISITSTGTLTGTPVIVAATTGTSTYSTLTHTVAGTGLTFTATAAGLTNGTSATFDINNFTYASGDYRSNPAFATTNPFNGMWLSSTVTVGGVEPWQTYDGSAWVDVVHAGGSPNAPSNLATKPGTIYITYGDYANGITVDAGGSATYNNIIVLNGGYLIGYASAGTTVTIPTGKSIEIYSGGYAEFAGSAPFTMASGSTLKVRDGGTLIINDPAINNTNAMWGGTEDFQDNSTLEIQDWDNTGSATVRSLLNPTYQVSTNTSGNSYKFGNIIYNYNPGTNDQTVLPALTATLNFCNNLTLNNISTTKSITITANQIQSPIAKIKGNVNILQGNVNFGINYTDNAKQQLTVLGNIDIQNTEPLANPTVVYLHNFGSGTTILDRMQLYLEGNLTVASGASLNTGPDASSQAMTMFNFTGTNAQSVNGAGTLSLTNVTINKSAQNVTLNRAFGATDSLTFTSGKFIIGVNDLTLGDASMGYQTGGTAASYAVTDNTGVYKRTVLSTAVNHLFPIGPSTTSYNPATLNYTGTIDTFTGRVEVGLNPTTTADAYFVNRTWNIEEAVATGTTATLKLQWETTAPTHENASFDNTDCDIYHYTGGTWVEQTSSTTAGTNPYTCSKGGLTSFSPHGVGKKLAPMPIELLSFTAKLNAKNIDLNWVTASELNNDYFTVERSADAVNFHEIHVTDGAGTSNQTLFYSTVDDAPLSGVSYYRLKQTDFNGAFAYSQVVSVEINNTDGFQIVNTFHAVENGSLNVTLNCSSNCLVNFELFDMTGKKVYSSTQNITGTNKTISVPTAMLSHGIYLLKAYNGKEIISKKVKL